MPERYVGFNPPFVGGPQKIMSKQSGDRLIANDVLQNLLILPGEIPFVNDFGVDLRNFTFEKMSVIDLRNLESSIRDQIVRNDDRLEIKSLNLTPDFDAGTLEISLIVSLKEDPDRNIEVKRLINTLLS